MEFYYSKPNLFLLQNFKWFYINMKQFYKISFWLKWKTVYFLILIQVRLKNITISELVKLFYTVNQVESQGNFTVFGAPSSILYDSRIQGSHLLITFPLFTWERS